MPDPGNTSLIEFNSWTLRIREASQQPSRLMLLIHGLTGDENSMWVFARNLSASYWQVAPRAPYRAQVNDQVSGYSWREGASSSPAERHTLEQLGASAEALIHLIDEYAASVGIDASTFDVMGFSQGAVIANALAFLYPQRVRKVGILAGFVPSGLEEIASQRPLEGKPFFVTHGTKDETVPVDRARASLAVLEEAGAKVTYCEDDVAHKVSANCLRALNEFFTD